MILKVFLEKMKENGPKWLWYPKSLFGTPNPASVLGLDSAYCGRPKSLYFHTKNDDFEGTTGWGALLRQVFWA